MPGPFIDRATRPQRSPVSVALATYNGAAFIAAQLDSILPQLGEDDQIVVVDDGSTDETVDRIARYADRRIEIFPNATNQGVLASFERALAAARHEIVFLCDQDDVWLPGKVDAVCARFTSDPRVLLVLSDAEVIDDGGRILERSFMALRGGFRAGFGATLVRNRYLGCTMAMRRRLLGWALPIPRDVPMHDMWLGSLAALLGRVEFIDRALVQYRRHAGNASPGRPQSIPTMVRWRWRLLKNVLMRLRAERRRPSSERAL